MRCCFLLLSAFAVAPFAAPQGYEYKEPAPVTEQSGFQAIKSSRNLPCTHASHHFNDAASALIQSQSTARIVNHQKHYSADHNLVTGASEYSPQPQAVDQTSFSQGASQTFQAGLGYVENGANFATQIPNAEPLNSVSAGSGQHVASAHNQGYIYNQAVSSHGQNHVQQHNQHHISTVNYPPQNLLRPSLPFYPLPSYGRPIAPGSVGNLAIARPLQSYGNTNSAFQNGVNGYAGSFDHIAHSTQHTVNAGTDFNFGNAGSFSSSGAEDALNGQLGHVIRETFANAPLDPSVEKHIYVHVPPEDLEEKNLQHPVAQHQLSAPAKKHYKIIFIKAPSAPAPNYSQLAAAAPQTEEKTLVYVLVKKPDEPSLEQIQEIQQSSYKSNKPEVYFIKYKTRKESEAGQYSANLPIPTELVKDDGDLIDIRSGGESSSSSTSTSYTSSAAGPTSEEGPQHELYGVPLN